LRERIYQNRLINFNYFKIALEFAAANGYLAVVKSVLKWGGFKKFKRGNWTTIQKYG